LLTVKLHSLCSRGRSRCRRGKFGKVEVGVRVERLHCLEFLERHNTSVISVLFSFPLGRTK